MTKGIEMLWTALVVILIFCLMGFSIELGWGVAHLLLFVAFGGAGRQPAMRATQGESGGGYFAISDPRCGHIGDPVPTTVH